MFSISARVPIGVYDAEALMVSLVDCRVVQVVLGKNKGHGQSTVAVGRMSVDALRQLPTVSTARAVAANKPTANKPTSTHSVLAEKSEAIPA